MAIHFQHWEEMPPAECRRGALTIGNFDGVHLGHVELLHETQQQSRRLGGPAVALTFDPHPLQLLRPESFQPPLTTTQDRVELLQGNGADQVVLIRTTQEFLQLTAERFFQEIVQRRFEVHSLVEGWSFGFGRGREGTLDMLRRFCQSSGVSLTVVEPVLYCGGAISSSRIRHVIMEGRVSEVVRMLGRPYRLRGVVAAGQRRGNTLGFPTANLEQTETVIPADGVYAVRVTHQGRTWPGAANIGPNPTFGENARKVEVHLIGFEGQLYGCTLAVDFVDRLRDTRPFANVGELVEQLHKDVKHAASVAAL